jgi:hypothetical protein
MVSMLVNLDFNGGATPVGIVACRDDLVHGSKILCREFLETVRVEFIVARDHCVNSASL